MVQMSNSAGTVQYSVIVVTWADSVISMHARIVWLLRVLVERSSHSIAIILFIHRSSMRNYSFKFNDDAIGEAASFQIRTYNNITRVQIMHSIFMWQLFKDSSKYQKINIHAHVLPCIMTSILAWKCWFIHA